MPNNLQNKTQFNLAALQFPVLYQESPCFMQRI